MKKSTSKASKTLQPNPVFDPRSQSVYASFKMLEGYAQPSLLAFLAAGKKRLSHISDEFNTVPARSLSADLRAMAQHSLIRKTEAGTMPVIIEYELTASGLALHKILDDLRTWANQYHPDVATGTAQ